MQFDTLKDLVSDEFQTVERLIQGTIDSQVSLVNDLYTYINQSGGKRFRPLMVLLMARACGYQGEVHLNLAAAIELIHTVTLLHDDVIDEASLRRGKPSANKVWGNSASILVGDYLYSRAFEMFVETQNFRILSMMSKITNIMTEGEVRQMLDRHNPLTTENTYFEIIRNKTGKLFEGAALIGAILAELPPELEKSVGNFGMHLGSAFQLVDDILDYQGDTAVSGKNLGNDLKEGKVTLPLIFTLQNCTPAEKTLVQKAIQEGGHPDLPSIIHIIEKTGGIEYTKALAQKEVEKAKFELAFLPASKYREGALDALMLATNRSF